MNRMAVFFVDPKCREGGKERYEPVPESELPSDVHWYPRSIRGFKIPLATKVRSLEVNLEGSQKQVYAFKLDLNISQMRTMRQTEFLGRTVEEVLKGTLENHLGKDVESAVIEVGTYLSGSQKEVEMERDWLKIRMKDYLGRETMRFQKENGHWEYVADEDVLI